MHKHIGRQRKTIVLDWCRQIVNARSGLLNVVHTDLELHDHGYVIAQYEYDRRVAALDGRAEEISVEFNPEDLSRYANIDFWQGLSREQDFILKGNNLKLPIKKKSNNGSQHGVVGGIEGQMMLANAALCRMTGVPLGGARANTTNPNPNPNPNTNPNPSQTTKKKLIQFLKNYEHPNYSRTMKTKAILLILKEPEFVENISVLIESNDSDGGFEVMDDISFLAYIEEFEK